MGSYIPRERQGYSDMLYALRLSNFTDDIFGVASCIARWPHLYTFSSLLLWCCCFAQN